MDPVLRRAGYGWVIVVIAALSMVATLPGRTHGLGMITERLLSDPKFDLDRVSYGTINLWATLLGGLFCLPCGWLIDRFGLRLTLTGTVAALAATVLWMTRIENVTSLSIAILLTRGFGQSALSIISITMVGKWFPDKLSWPMAVYSLLLSLGFAYSAQLAKPFANDDWRVVWNGMGYLLLAGIPVALFFTREPRSGHPHMASKEANVLSTPPVRITDPYAYSHLPSEEANVVVAEKSGFTLRQATGTAAFWVFGIAISLVALIGSGTSLFNESVLQQQGFPKEIYYDLITLSGTVGLLFKLPIGWLGRWVPLNRLLTVGLLLQSICMALLPRVHSQYGITLYGIGMGISGTMTTILFFTIWGEAYGKAHLGRIQSIAQMMTVLASAGGPLLFAKCFDRFGSYAGIFYVLSAVAAIIALWSWLIRVPRPEDALQAISHSPVSVVMQPTLDEAS